MDMLRISNLVAQSVWEAIQYDVKSQQLRMKCLMNSSIIWSQYIPDQNFQLINSNVGPTKH